MSEAKDRNDILRKVQALVEKANATEFEEEKDAFLKKADTMMAVYAIEAYELEFAKSARDKSRQPITDEVDYGTTGDREADGEIHEIFWSLAGLCNVLIGYYGYRNSRVVGYAEDVEYLRLLMTNVQLNMAATIQPKPSKDLSPGENIAMLKEAGYKWQRIYEELIELNPESRDLVRAFCPADHNHKMYRCIEAKNGTRYFVRDFKDVKGMGPWLIGSYKKWAAANGRETVGANPDTYRRSFRAGYIMAVRTRINEMKRARESAGTGKELVLSSMREELQEALYVAFPEKRPHPPGCDCDTHHFCDNQRCKRPNCVARRAPVKASRYGYRTEPERKIDSAAMRAGEKAGSQVDLSGGRRNVPGSAPKELG